MSERFDGKRNVPSVTTSAIEILTCHIERDEDGHWWTVWSDDFSNASGRKPHPESVFLEEAYRRGYQSGYMDGCVACSKACLAIAVSPKIGDEELEK